MYAHRDLTVMCILQLFLHPDQLFHFLEPVPVLLQELLPLPNYLTCSCTLTSYSFFLSLFLSSSKSCCTSPTISPVLAP